MEKERCGYFSVPVPTPCRQRLESAAVGTGTGFLRVALAGTAGDFPASFGECAPFISHRVPVQGKSAALRSCHFPPRLYSGGRR
ncbi:hypothetical protein F2Y52_22820 [Bacteroides caccae]|uniref:hypothetical protein n=1 Tax=Bacteroides caccae TaxID=47678 RepID=UPI0012316708|nr:hypothetical protein F2Y52_22820 [Bacteroides caccae]